MITMEQAKRYGNIHTEIMIDNGLIHDKEIREPLFDYLEETRISDSVFRTCHSMLCSLSNAPNVLATNTIAGCRRMSAEK